MGWVGANGLLMPSLGMVQWAPGSASSVIDATGEKYAWIGRVWNKDHTTKTLERVQFQFGTVTKAGGSGLTVSLQDVSLTSGPAYQPDETQDQTVAIANGDASFASSTWYRTGTFSAGRSVAYGELLAVVIEYNGSGRLGADAVNLNIRNSLTARWPGVGSGAALKTGGTWAAVAGIPNILLEFSDGSFGTLDQAIPNDGSYSSAYNTGSAADEQGNVFTVPFMCKVDALWCGLQVASGADFDMVLYEGTTALASGSQDSNAIEGTAVSRLALVPIAETTLRPGTTYRVVLKPTTANNVTIYGLEVADAAHMDAWPFGQNWQYTDRADAGAWGSTDTTRRLWAGVRVSQMHVAPSMLVNNAGLVG